MFLNVVFLYSFLDCLNPHYDMTSIHCNSSDFCFLATDCQPDEGVTHGGCIPTASAYAENMLAADVGAVKANFGSHRIADRLGMRLGG